MANPDPVETVSPPVRSPVSHRRIRWGTWFLWGLFLLFLLEIGVVLESFGVINLMPTFGRGGQPLVGFGRWQRVDFADVPDDYWARPYIEELAQRGIVQDDRNSEFRPDAPITRAEFAVMLQKAFELNAASSNPDFGDVLTDAWAAPAIAQVTAAGFMQGYPDGRFRPNQEISRAEALTALARGLNVELTADTTVEGVLRSNYTDAVSIPDYAKDAIATATDADLVKPYPDAKTLSPNQPATRADASVYIYQALVHLGRAGHL